MKPGTEINVAIRRFLLALAILGVLLATLDLLLLGHYEDTPQLIPLALNAAAVVSFGWYAVFRNRASVWAIRAVMSAFVLVACVGVFLHFQGNLEFQLEIDPSRPRWELFKKVMRASAPPALAPLALAQLGLIGLMFTYRHPLLDGEQSETGD